MKEGWVMTFDQAFPLLLVVIGVLFDRTGVNLLCLPVVTGNDLTKFVLGEGNL
jgi:hypothetical protein